MNVVVAMQNFKVINLYSHSLRMGMQIFIRFNIGSCI